MTKWTPDITEYPLAFSPEWGHFTSRIWYNELEFYFSTVFGLLVSVAMYYGRTSEEVSTAEETGEILQEGAFHLQVNKLHTRFIQRTFPQLLAPKTPMPPSHPSTTPLEATPEQRNKRQTENYYRHRHNQRMWAPGGDLT